MRIQLLGFFLITLALGMLPRSAEAQRDFGHDYTPRGGGQVVARPSCLIFVGGPHRSRSGQESRETSVSGATASDDATKQAGSGPPQPTNPVTDAINRMSPDRKQLRRCVPADPGEALEYIAPSREVLQAPIGDSAITAVVDAVEVFLPSVSNDVTPGCTFPFGQLGSPAGLASNLAEDRHPARSTVARAAGFKVPQNPITEWFEKTFPDPKERREVKGWISKIPGVGSHIEDLERELENMRDRIVKEIEKAESKQRDAEKRAKEIDKAIEEFTKNSPIKIVPPAPPKAPRSLFNIGLSPRTPDSRSQTFAIDQQRKEQRETSRTPGSRDTGRPDRTGDRPDTSRSDRGNRERSGNPRL